MNVEKSKLFLQIWLGKIQGVRKRDASKFTDERTSLMSQLLSGIKVVKLYAWESALEKKTADIRKMEIEHLKGFQLIRSTMRVALFCLPALVPFVALSVFVGMRFFSIKSRKRG